MSSEARLRKLNRERQKLKENQNKKHNQQLKSIEINDNNRKINLQFSLLKEESSPLVEKSSHENENTSKFAYDGPQSFEFSSNSKFQDEVEIVHLRHNNIQYSSENNQEKLSNSNVLKHANHSKKLNKESSGHVGFNYSSMVISDSEENTEEEVDKVKCNSNKKSSITENYLVTTMLTESSENDLDNSINVSNVAVAPLNSSSRQSETLPADDGESFKQDEAENDIFHGIHDSLVNSNMEIESFVTRPAPEECVVKCRITRDKKGVDKGMFPTYYLHLERRNSKPLFLLAARRRRLSKTSNYLISCDATDMKRHGYGFLAKLRSNFIGTHFTLYDHGQNPQSNSDSKKPLRKELAAIIYETNVLGFKGPRKMTIIIPGMTPLKVPIDFQPQTNEDDLLECCRTRKLNNLLELHNKKPIWNEDSQSYVLNFHGRVTQASVKNFQIVHDNDAEYIIMQFGRTSDHSFSMDFAYPLSAIQAFGIALSSFDGKLACE